MDGTGLESSSVAEFSCVEASGFTTSVPWLQFIKLQISKWKLVNHIGGSHSSNLEYCCLAWRLR